jgi:dimethylargininase
VAEILIAITRAISPAITRCELTHLSRQTIDLDVARAQHREYEQRLADAGCSIVRLETSEDMPDSVFVEDTAVVFDELAVITRPGAASRRGETMAVAEALRSRRALRFIEPPGCLDGGDVLVVGKRVFIGVSGRTNGEAIAQMQPVLNRFGYAVEAVQVHGCLHLKSAVTLVADDTVLLNRAFISTQPFRRLTVIEVDAREARGANALRVGNHVIYPTAFPRTHGRLEQHGLVVHGANVSELMKAEGAVTCCSLVLTV